jgi:death-on-curing protein
MEGFRWVTKKMALAIHDRQMAEHGGQEGIRDESLLESALARPVMKMDYGDPPPDLCELAACYAHGLAKNHPFLDGNKRTAFVVYRLFLRLNGLDLNASREDRYFQMLSLAAGEHTEESFAAWLRTVTEDV